MIPHARGLFCWLTLTSALLGCGEGPAPERLSSDFKEFTCTAKHVKAGEPRAYFGPFDDLDKESLCVLGLAQKEVLVAHYNIRNQAFLDELVALKARGVDVRVAVDLENSKNEWNVGDDFLEEHGIPVVRFRPKGKGALMHLKVAVVDGEIAMTGSFNWNGSASLANEENLVVLRDPAVIERYAEEVREILGDFPPGPTGGQATDEMAVHFSPEEPLDGVLAEHIASAASTIDVAMFTFTSKPLESALQEALGRGVRVRLVTERKQTGLSTIDENLEAAGAEVVRAANRIGPHTAMHHKYAVIDGEKVLTGAANWTNAGTRVSDEDVLVVGNDRFARAYAENFADLLHVYAGLEESEPSAERAGVLFHALHDGTEPGDRLVIVGSAPELGAWRVDEGIELRTTDDLFPSWTARTRLPAGSQVEYKFVVLRASGEIAWEPGENRRLSLPASGRGTVVTGRFGDTSKSWTPTEAP